MIKHNEVTLDKLCALFSDEQFNQSFKSKRDFFKFLLEFLELAGSHDVEEALRDCMSVLYKNDLRETPEFKQASKVLHE